METKGPQDRQYHEYEPPNVVPIASRPRPVTTFLDALRATGIPETVIDQARSVLGSIGLTDGSVNEVREAVDRGTRQGMAWSRKNPRKAAGGLAAAVLAFGLILLLLERRE